MRNSIRSRWPVWVLVLLGVVVILHPYVLGLIGRINENIFRRELHVGMARGEVLARARALGYVREPWKRDEVEGATGPLYIQFVDFDTLCISGGKAFDLNFDNHLRLTTWVVTDWQNAC